MVRLIKVSWLTDIQQCSLCLYKSLQFGNKYNLYSSVGPAGVFLLSWLILVYILPAPAVSWLNNVKVGREHKHFNTPSKSSFGCLTTQEQQQGEWHVMTSVLMSHFQSFVFCWRLKKSVRTMTVNISSLGKKIFILLWKNFIIKVVLLRYLQCCNHSVWCV